MAQPSVYLDTTIIAAYWFEGKDLVISARRQLTREWWAAERRSFELYTSAVSEREFRAGKYPRQRQCVRMNSRLAYVSVTNAVKALAAELLGLKIIPAGKLNDALQLALATAHQIDYLLTWNYAHLANPVVQERLADLCNQRRLAVPYLVSPETIPWLSRGQRIKKRS